MTVEKWEEWQIRPARPQEEYDEQKRQVVSAAMNLVENLEPQNASARAYFEQLLIDRCRRVQQLRDWILREDPR